MLQDGHTGMLGFLVRLSAMDPEDAEVEICKASVNWLPPPHKTPAIPASMLNSNEPTIWAIWAQSFLKKTQQKQHMVIDATAWRIRGQRLKGVDHAWRRYKQRKDNGNWRAHQVALNALRRVRLE